MRTFTQFCIPLAGLAFNVLCQILSLQLGKRIRLFQSIMLGFAAGFLLVCILELTLFFYSSADWLDFLAYWVCNMITYGCLGYGYFAYINLGESSLRIRIIDALLHAPDGLTEETLIKRFNDRELLAMRIRRLLDHGEIQMRDGKYVLGKSKLVPIAKIVFLLKWLILGKRSEFE